MGVQINRSFAPTYNIQRAIACQEIGHAITGALHEGPGCMGYSYQGIVAAGNNNADDPVVRSPSFHDHEHSWALWSQFH